MNTQPPPWNNDDKRGSLRTYAEWLHETARNTFLQDGTHIELFFLMDDDGKGEINPAPPGMDRNELVSILKAHIQSQGFYGVIHVAESHCRLKNDPDTTSEALIFTMESRDGDTCCWIDPVVRNADCVALADSIRSDKPLEGRFAGYFSS